MPYRSDNEIPSTDYTPMWEIYLKYLKKLLPWEQRTVVMDRNAIMEMTQLEESKGSERGGKPNAKRSGKKT